MSGITAHLENLILSGQAEFKNFVAGGSSKNELTVGTNRFVVIVGFTYYPFCPINPIDKSNSTISITQYDGQNLTQMNVFSDRSLNSFVFKNEFHLYPTGTDGEFKAVAGSPVYMPTYLVHEKDVGFNFTVEPEELVDRLITNTTDQAPPNVKNLNNPSDYGGLGLNTSVPVPLRRDWGLIGQIRPLGKDSITANINPSFTQLQIPVGQLQTDIKNEIDLQSVKFPVVNVAFVEVEGKKGELVAKL